MYRVMIADDEPIVRKALVALTDWKALDCEIVYVASNGREIIENISNTTPDIIITDIQMPEISGIDIARYVFEEKLPIKIILLTAYADFSYAHSAMKYNVVEYVIKNGAMDNIKFAIEKVKTLISKEIRETGQEDQDAAIEHFMKSIIDESIYDSAEIENKLAGFPIRMEYFIASIIRFKRDFSGDNEKRSRNQRSLTNFFDMAFTDQKPIIIPIYKNTFLVVFDDVKEDYHTFMEEQCQNVIDIMDNFMDLGAYIGISEIHHSIRKLKNAFEQAKEALYQNFLWEGNKINFYCKRDSKKDVYLKETDGSILRICQEIKQGEGEKAVILFQTLTVTQKEKECSSETIKNSGVMIENGCRKILSDYEVDLWDFNGCERNMTQLIYNCCFLEEYCGIMEDLIWAVAEYVHNSIHKREFLINKCISFIDENYHKNINVSDVADSVNVSAGYLSRVFREKTGNTMIGTINQKKIDKAKEYLIEGEMKIYEIADALGFENTTYFSHFFRKHTKVSPKDYRNYGAGRE